MKIKADVRELKKVIMAVSRAVDQKPSTPSLQGIYIRCLDGVCEVIGSDLDLIIKAKANVHIEVEGECLVNAKILTEVMRKLPSGKVIVSDLGSEIKIETERSEYNLRKLDHLTYPSVLLNVNYNESKSQKIFADELFSSLKKVGVAASPEGGKPILTGVYFDNTENKTNLVSTDSYRLAVNTVFDLPITDAGIVSFRSLNEVIKLFEESEEEIFINSSERELHFYNNIFYAAVRKLEGNFPAYENLFPKENLFSLEIQKSNILEALDRSTVVAEGFIPVTLKIVDENTLNISTTNKDIGGGTEDVDVKILGLEVGDLTGFEMSFNPNFLIQGIEVLEGSNAYLRFSSNEKPIVIQGEEEHFQYLLMPVRTSWGMFSDPEKFNPENNRLGINFKNSEKVKKFIENSEFVWKNNVIPGPVTKDSVVLYVDNQRVKKIVQLQTNQFLIELEKKTNLVLKFIDVQITNTQQ